MGLASVRRVSARVQARWLAVVLLLALVSLAAMTILGGYNLRIRSFPVDIDLSSRPFSDGVAPQR